MNNAAAVLAFQVGQRVCAAGDARRVGTVRYVGAVEGHSGEWVGVEWDNGEGKNDGSLDGIRYFNVSRGEISASFVRPKAISAGISLFEALHLRYRGDSTKEEEDDMYVLSTRNKRVNIEFVGKDKIQEKLSHFEDLFGASVPYMGVGSIGSPTQINALVPNLKELDLTGNLFSRWKDIADICEALPTLKVLDLTSNLMGDEVLVEMPSLQRIQIFVLNHCGMTWELIEKHKPWIPDIEEIHLMANNLRAITASPESTIVQGFFSLRHLNLEDNLIDDWEEIAKLSQLRCLEQLHLNRNYLKHIFYPMGHDTKDKNDILTRPFERLQCLLLGCNKIEDLKSVDSLNLFPSLQDIRLSENPIVDSSKGGVPRFVLVARLEKVQILNGSEVSARERKESEIRYVRLVMAKMMSEDPDRINQLHPRFFVLKEMHGIEDEKPSNITTGPQKMASGLICITLKCVGASMGEKQPLARKLPPTTTVGRLKNLCESFFKLKGVEPRLFIQEEGSPFPQLLDDDMAALLDLGVGSEATILVDEEP